VANSVPPIAQFGPATGPPPTFAIDAGIGQAAQTLVATQAKILADIDGKLDGAKQTVANGKASIDRFTQGQLGAVQAVASELQESIGNALDKTLWNGLQAVATSTAPIMQAVPVVRDPLAGPINLRPGPATSATPTQPTGPGRSYEPPADRPIITPTIPEDSLRAIPVPPGSAPPPSGGSPGGPYGRCWVKDVSYAFFRAGSMLGKKILDYQKKEWVIWFLTGPYPTAEAARDTLLSNNLAGFELDNPIGPGPIDRPGWYWFGSVRNCILGETPGSPPAVPAPTPIPTPEPLPVPEIPPGIMPGPLPGPLPCPPPVVQCNCPACDKPINVIVPPETIREIFRDYPRDEIGEVTPPPAIIPTEPDGRGFRRFDEYLRGAVMHLHSDDSWDVSIPLSEAGELRELVEPQIAITKGTFRASEAAVIADYDEPGKPPVEDSW